MSTDEEKRVEIWTGYAKAAKRRIWPDEQTDGHVAVLITKRETVFDGLHSVDTEGLDADLYLKMLACLYHIVNSLINKELAAISEQSPQSVKEIRDLFADMVGIAGDVHQTKLDERKRGPR